MASLCKGSAAGMAELTTGLIACPAVGTIHQQRITALRADPGATEIRMAALGTGCG
jgi:hypothetical protein